jgi:hypothetical protein
MIDQELLKAEIKRLTDLHEKLEIALSEELSAPMPNNIRVQKLKKEKLKLKDLLRRCKALLIPDIIA